MAFNSSKAFTWYNIIIFPWDGANYGTGIALDDRQYLTAELQVDTDKMKSAGVDSALLSVVTGAKGKFSQGRVQIAVLDTITGESSSNSGASGSRVRNTGVDAGEDLPYFGVVGHMYGENGENIVVGLPLFKADAPPGFTMTDQNKFHMTECSGSAIANALSATPTRVLFIKEQETAALITDGDTFFGIS